MKPNSFNPQLDLMLERIIDLPPEKIWKAWTTPDILMKWFCPKPWKVVKCKIDLKPGGEFSTTMQSPEGEEHPGSGCYLEVIENKKLVWTDALSAGYRPNDKAFMTGTIILEPHGAGTKYTAIATHANEDIKKQHEAMGFEQGWGIALDQLIEEMKK